MEPLYALQHADRHRKDQRGGKGDLGEHDDSDRVDVEQIGERNRQCECERNEGAGRDNGNPQRSTREHVGSLGITRCDAPRDLAGDCHLQCAGGNQHDGEKAEQRRQRAVVLAAEYAACRQEEGVIDNDPDGRRRSHQDAAARTAGSGARLRFGDSDHGQLRSRL